MSSTSKRLSRSYRGEQPAPIDLTERDDDILEMIYAFDGLLSLKQIDRRFFSGKGGSWSRERMRALTAHGFVRTATPEQAHYIPRGETVFWLDSKGAERLASRRGLLLSEFSWRQAPRLSLVAHDLAVNNFRLDVLAAVESHANLKLHQWIVEGEFLSAPDTVYYEDQQGQERKRQMRPDAFFTIRQSLPAEPTRARQFAYLLEIDLGTETNARFARDKVVPGIAYLRSATYQQRFGVNYGRWLVVTTSEQRLQNMLAATLSAGGEGLFYFTTLAQVAPPTVLHAPIWQVAGQTAPATLVNPEV